jgi:hypothetical protein
MLATIQSRTSSSHLLPKNLSILPVVLYGCKTWSLTLREEPGLNVFENRLLRRILGLKRDEVVGDWRGLHSFITCSTLRQVYLE